MKADFLIIGAGVVGLATAWHLKCLQPRLRITVLEQYPRICSGNSGRSAALYRNLFASRTSRDLAESSILHYQIITWEMVLKPNGYLWYMNRRHWQTRMRNLAERSTAACVARSLSKRWQLGMRDFLSPPEG